MTVRMDCCGAPAAVHTLSNEILPNEQTILFFDKKACEFLSGHMNYCQFLSGHKKYGKPRVKNI